MARSLSGTVTHVKIWRDGVIAHYGSMSAFGDSRSTRIMRQFVFEAIAEHNKVANGIVDENNRREFFDVFAEDYQAARRLVQQLTEDIETMLMVEQKKDWYMTGDVRCETGDEALKIKESRMPAVVRQTWDGWVVTTLSRKQVQPGQVPFQLSYPEQSILDRWEAKKDAAQ